MSRIADRIFDCLPSGNYAVAALLRLFDIVETDRIETAGVECTAEPRLLVNPAFLDAEAATPEKLLMLVMHELHHVLLGHTTLFPRMTPVQNFVFDAVINGVISRMFPGREHVAMLTDFYSDRAFPECLLGPPADWNGRDVATLPPGISGLPRNARCHVEDVYRGLYSDTGVSYEEVYDVLPRVLVGYDVDGVPLLGGHDVEGTDEAVSRSRLLVNAIRAIVEEWTQPPNPIRGRSLADMLQHLTVHSRLVPTNRAVLRHVMRRVADLSQSGRRFRMRGNRTVTAASAIPSLDRRTLVLRALGCEPLLHGSTIDSAHRVPRGDRVHVYIDVSGSMEELREAVYGAVVDCAAFVHRRVHLFSTAVVDLGLPDLRRGMCATTGGTDIACVAAHLRTHDIHRAVIITDGWVGVPSGGDHATLSRTRLGVCYIGGTSNVNDLAGVAHVTAHLATGGR